jgi:hypothetical protein
MRRRALCGLGLMAAFGNSVCADWKVATVYTHDAVDRLIVSSGTEYFKNGMRRIGCNRPSAGLAFELHPRNGSASHAAYRVDFG